MRKTAVCAALALVLGVANQGNAKDTKDTLDSAMGELIGLMKNYLSIMDKVKDEDTAKAAKPKLEALVKKVQDLDKRMQGLGSPSAEEEQRLKEKYQSEFQKLRPKMRAAQEKQQKYEVLKNIKLGSPPR